MRIIRAFTLALAVGVAYGAFTLVRTARSQSATLSE